MRTFAALFLAMYYQQPWLWALVPVALAWDAYETFLKKAVQIVLPQQQATAGPLATKVAQLIGTRKQCADTNDCPDCKEFIARFKALVMPEGEIGAPGHEPMPETTPVKAFPSGGYL